MAETNENGNRNDGGEARILKQGFPVPTDIIGFIIGKKVQTYPISKKQLVPNCQYRTEKDQNHSTEIGHISSYRVLATKLTVQKNY